MRRPLVIKRPIFEPDLLHDCGLAGVGLPRLEMLRAVEDALERAYPGHIHRDQPWLFSNAGGVMIQMKVYFASIFEYVILWGTPIGSEGHSGRHQVGFWDTVLEGEAWYSAENWFHRRVYRPGDRIYVGPGQARGMKFSADLWALEYARGPIPLSLPFGLADASLSTLDAVTVAQTAGTYMDLLGRHWAQSARDAEGIFSREILGRALRPVGKIVQTLGAAVTRYTAPAPATDDIPDDAGHPRSPASLGLPSPIWPETSDTADHQVQMDPPASPNPHATLRHLDRAQASG